MIANDQLSRDDVLDALLDLKHDLGKYIRLPLAMLPAEAGDAEVREALGTALLKTRNGPNGVHTAEDLWSGFTEEVGRAIAGYTSAPGLRETVERALAWRASLENDADAIDRQQAETELGAVREAIQRLIEEVHDGDR
ncbi:MAG: hypothetical protein JRF63_06830 [Deltaproteobacteria bacterium]|nr:hypothetical protein [Deltaproteobacteria bacterium]